MKFIDEVDIEVRGGNGGDGCVAFRRARFAPTGGPAGGDGGKGGDVVLVADERLTTLLDLRYHPKQAATSGEPGRGKDCYGSSAEDRIVRVPVGTQAHDVDSQELLIDLTEPGQHLVVARGGRGGRGNIHFATPFNRSPRTAEPGEPGVVRRLRLELKLLADVGIIGFPNTGKSTLISRVSRARPKIADYPFTTLQPNLGVVQVGSPEESFVIADVPGLIPGASRGAGLGIRFLKHVERTRVLLHLLAPDAAPGRSPLPDFDAINRELSQFDPELGKRQQVVALNKLDIIDSREELEALKSAFSARGIALHGISAVTGEGVRELMLELWRRISECRAAG